MKTLKKKSSALLFTSYAPLLADLKARVRTAQVKAALSVNRELILLYWHIGREILRAQKAEGWGTKVVQRLAKDLAEEFPEMGGFSARNLKYMLAFVETWAAIGIVQQPVALLGATTARGESVSQPVSKLASPIVPQPVTQLEDAPPEPLALLPWGTNLVLLHKLKDPAARLWYACKTLEQGWSRAVLTVQIETKLHERSGKAVTNFAQTLPPAQSDMAREVLKDPYTFDFLSLSEAAHERDLERGLVEHIRQFLLELGAGFAFVGQQVHLGVGDEDFYLDLLFYHLQLRCFVVVDLKMKPFEPEFAGKIHPMRYRTLHPFRVHLHALSHGVNTMRYTRYVLLRLRSQKSQRRSAIHRIHARSSPTPATTRGGRGAVHCVAASHRTHLLRGMSHTKRCNPPREVSKICMGQEIPQDAAPRLSHGVNFHLSAVDDQMRHPDVAPTIGLLLCKDTQNKLKIEYALRDVKKPIGVAQWQTRLVESLPKNLRGSLPTIAELEHELRKSKR